MATLRNLWKPGYWLLLLLLGQALILFFTFDDMFKAPGQYMFANFYDGMRQYYFFQAYVDQTPDQSWLKVEEVGYPYGEYLLYTDGTPLLAFVTRLVSTYVVDLRNHGIDVFNYFIILGRLLSTYLAFLILGRLGVKDWRRLLFALALPWINGEIIKLGGGQLNLSLSWPYLLTIYTALRLYQAYETDKTDYRWAIAFAVLISLTAFLHLYYLPLTTVVLGFALLSYLIHLWRKHRDVVPIVGYGLITCLSPWIVVMGLIRLTDGYFADRIPKGEGYGWDRWVFELSGFYSSHRWNSIRFIIEDRNIVSYGAHAYLGNFALFFGVILLLVFWLNRSHSLSIRHYLTREQEGSFFRWLGVGVLVSVLISLGERIFIWGQDYLITNYLNLFFYLHKITDRITQFRDVSRFGFIGFWWFNFLAIYLYDRWVRTQSATWVRVVALGLLIMLVIDTKDGFRHAHQWQRPNLLYQRELSDIDDLIEGVDLSAYQAALPIPYFHEGVGDNHYAVDGFDDVITHTFQLQRWGDIPLITSKFARGNQPHGLQLISLLQGDSTGKGIAPELLAQLDDRPILVLYDENFYNGNRELTGNQLQPAWELLQTGHQIIERYDMQEVKRYGHFRLYRWEIGRLR
jgi:hypothetical protein